MSGILAVLLGLALGVPCARAQSDEDGVRRRAAKAFEELDRHSGARGTRDEDKPAKKAAPAKKKPAAKPEPPVAEPAVAPESAAPAQEPEPPAPVREPEKESLGVPVMIYWHMADDADVYLNGRPLRDYAPSFKTRYDEAPLPAFSTTAVLRDGDVFTVGGRRGGSYGFMLAATDFAGRVVFKTDADAWRVYEPGDRQDWREPATARDAVKRPVAVQPDPWHPQKELNAWSGAGALSIWGEPKDTFAYLVGTTALGGEAGAPRPVSLRSKNYPEHRVLHRDRTGLIAVPGEKDKKAATFTLLPGLADPRHVSLESKDQPGYYLAAHGGRVALRRDDGAKGFKESATFKMAPGLADKSWVSFESPDTPGVHVRHKGFQLYVESGSDDLFRQDATFQLAEPLDRD
ncbi:MAG: AbfB domain-containing protein [Elusimicrobia bacterium]|nr:AbfB domain-containing protein [Elusimicrobiota bacterium]